MAAALAQRLQRIERVLAALPPCPCAGGPRLCVVGRGQVPEAEVCEVCGRELDAVLFMDPYRSEEDPT